MGHCRAVLDSISLDLLSVIVVTAVRESCRKIADVSLKQKNYDSAVHLITIILDTVRVKKELRENCVFQNVYFNVTI